MTEVIHVRSQLQVSDRNVVIRRGNQTSARKASNSGTGANGSLTPTKHPQEYANQAHKPSFCDMTIMLWLDCYSCLKAPIEAVSSHSGSLLPGRFNRPSRKLLGPNRHHNLSN